MEILISLSKMVSPLPKQKVVLENAKANEEKAKRSVKLAQDTLQERQQENRNVDGAKKELGVRNVIRRRATEVVRAQQQRLGRAQTVDRLIAELERLEKVEDTDANKKTNEERRANLRKQIADARTAMNKIKLPKSTVKRKKRR
jgi:hypothetical protein